MKISTDTFKGRKGWTIDNGTVSAFLMAGGGHIAALRLSAKPSVNPLWVPHWKTMEPWKYKRSHEGKYAAKLLASISGHNLCLGAFGDPSEEEARAGTGCHGEAPVKRWKQLTRKVTAKTLTFACGCDLPVAGMRFKRTMRMRSGSNVIAVNETITSLSAKDQPYTMCQHVTFGPPFLKQNVTVFDMNATSGHTFPGQFGKPQRLKPDTAFKWPYGPGPNGKKVDLHRYTRNKHGDFATLLMNPKHDHAWFSALNPELGILVAYVWNRKDYPWIGDWEENHARKESPWNGKSLTRGMEFTNSPFPVGLRKAVDMSTFQGQPTYRWLPAKSTIRSSYRILMLPTPSETRGVADIRPTGNGFEIDLIK